MVCPSCFWPGFAVFYCACSLGLSRRVVVVEKQIASLFGGSLVLVFWVTSGVLAHLCVCLVHWQEGVLQDRDVFEPAQDRPLSLRQQMHFRVSRSRLHVDDDGVITTRKDRVCRPLL